MKSYRERSTYALKSSARRLIRMLLLTVLLFAIGIESVSAEYEEYLDDAQAAVITADTKVYQSASTSSAYVKVSKGLEVNLLATKSGWALIEKDGVYGFVDADYVSTDTDETDDDDDYSSLLEDAQAAVITANTKVYKSASTSSKSVSVSKGLSVNLLATSGSWALIERNGNYAFIKAKYVSTDVDDDEDDSDDTVDYSSLLENAQEAVITANTKVYKSASTSSASVKVSKGLSVNLLATSGNWALIERNGVYAFINIFQVSVVDDDDDDEEEDEEEDTTSTTDYSSLLDDAQAAVINTTTLVYASASTSSKSTTVKKGTSVNLLATSGGWALIEKNGVYGFVDEDTVTLEADVTPTPTPTTDYSSLLDDAQAAVMNTTTLVYASASTSSTSTTISKGTSVNLLATSGGWALIERNGNYGFVDEDTVTLEADVTPTPTATTSSTSYLDSDDYTNEEKIYLFLTQEAGFNTAAACGILANFKKESNFNPASGSSYYGLAQWGGSRLTNLKSYCSENGYEVSSLEGQLNFLMYELENSYTSVLKYLQSVEDSAEGAYDAGYYFCYYYERPSNKASKSVSRGELARDTYYAKYGS